MELVLVQAGLFVFLMRIIDMSLDTFRLLLVMRGRKLYAGMIGAVQATVFILAVSTVLRGPLNFWTVSGYAAGFGGGVILGMLVEERLAIGYAMLRVYSPSAGNAIADALRQAGYAVTEFAAQGQAGHITVVNLVLLRRQVPAVRAIIDGVDPRAFITIDEAHPLQRGYFRH
ncbi:MAG: DUF2179 domain-containing protein [Chloroflexota bacterium]|nr:DUF2179 domain-containing protein [Chloroflexota bacterium]